MTRDPGITIRIEGRAVLAAALLVLAVLAFVGFSGGAWAQKEQESFKSKFNIADDQGGVAVATSEDGRYVYVAGPQGVIVSEDFGRTGSWVQTVKLK